MNSMKKALSSTLLSTLMLTGCSTLQDDLAQRNTRATTLAAGSGLKAATFDASLVPIQSFYKIQNPEEEEAVIYIEGDGLAWLSPSTPSPNPTPVDPLSLRLATEDASPNVIYLARPCQYAGRYKAACRTNKYWTSHRFAPEVIHAYRQVMATLKARYGFKKFHLVGYSGGGAIAILLAAKREDIASLRTLAGNLDHQVVNRHHGVDAMPHSLNPVDVAPQLAHVPQQHYVGALDTLIPNTVMQSYKQALADTRCLQVQEVAGASHYMGWQGFWADAVDKLPTCK